MSKEINVDYETFRKTRWQRFQEWRSARVLRFSTWRKDVVGSFTQRGWVETQAEVATCKLIRSHYSRNGYVGVGGWAVTFNYAVDGKNYDGIVISPAEVQAHDAFAIRYNPAHPGQNNSFDSETSWFDGFVMIVYDVLLVAFMLGLVIAGIRLRH